MTAPSPRDAGTPDVLAAILRRRRRDVDEARSRVPMRDLLREAGRRRRISLAARLASGPPPRILAEIKKASPSAGVLRPDFDPAGIAREYAAAGAAGISVLTEPHRFLGGESDLRAVRAAVELPLLRKDFLFDSYQLAEAAAWGADAVLLIVAALEPAHCERLHREARDLGLETLVEVHTEAELEVARRCEGAIVGVNSRDLRTLATDLQAALRLRAALPADALCIAESGIRTPADLEQLAAAGYAGFLVGETLLRAPSPGAALRALAGRGSGCGGKEPGGLWW